MSEQKALLNPATQVFFRAGLIACREYMARFVAAESPSIAASIRANWWPNLGQDFGPPRQVAWDEVTDGEFGTETFRVKGADEVSPTHEALPIAFQFLGGLTSTTPQPAQPSEQDAPDAWLVEFPCAIGTGRNAFIHRDNAALWATSVNSAKLIPLFTRPASEGAGDDLVRALAADGIRFDLNPCHDMSSLAAAESFWHDYVRRIDSSIRERASAALTSKQAGEK